MSSISGFETYYKLSFHALNVSVILSFAWNSATILPICFAVGKNSITANYLFKQIGKLSHAAWKACHAHLNSKKTEIQIGQTATKFWAVVPAVRRGQKNQQSKALFLQFSAAWCESWNPGTNLNWKDLAFLMSNYKFLKHPLHTLAKKCPAIHSFFAWNCKIDCKSSIFTN